MRTTRIAASFLALGMFALPVAAQQAGTNTAAPSAAAQPAGNTQAALKAFLADQRPASALTLPELRHRLIAGRELLQSQSLDPASLRQLRAMMKDARAEFANRKTASGQTQTQSQTQTGNATVQAPVPSANAPSAAAGASPAGLDQLLNDNRPASALSDAELKSRFDGARGFMPNQTLTQVQRQSLQKLARESRTEMGRRSSAQKQTGANQQSQGTNTQAQAGGQTQAGQAQVGGQTQVGQAQVGQTQVGGQAQTSQIQPNGVQLSVPAYADSLLNDTRALNTLTIQELRQRLRMIHQMQQQSSVARETRRQLGVLGRAARAEILSRGGMAGGNGQQGNGQQGNGQAGNGQQGNGQQGNGQAGGGNGQAGGALNPDVEKRAQIYLNDSQRVQQMSDPDLRQRLQGMRDLLQANQLSPATQRALRMKLSAERDILRARLGAAGNGQGGGNGQAGGGNGQAGGGNGQAGNGQGDTVVNINVVLADRRPPSALPEWELRRRIDVYRDAVLQQQYAAQRAQMIAILEQDRMFLRQRLMERRRARTAELAGQRQNNQINVNLGMQFDPGRPPAPPSVFAAEVDDQQIEDTLTAPPRRAISRRYTVQEVEASPDLRDALPRVEIDTIHFGFGESFVREEEVDNLDKIAAVLEKILTAHPREVFIIEGHTDAVGSPEANLDLSRRRAEAVKQALIDYYVVPPENLQAVGYGERFLKIPTPDPEPENRRVSVVRATPLVGELPQ